MNATVVKTSLCFIVSSGPTCIQLQTIVYSFTYNNCFKPGQQDSSSFLSMDVFLEIEFPTESYNHIDVASYLHASDILQ